MAFNFEAKQEEQANYSKTIVDGRIYINVELNIEDLLKEGVKERVSLHKIYQENQTMLDNLDLASVKMLIKSGKENKLFVRKSRDATIEDHIRKHGKHGVGRGFRTSCILAGFEVFSGDFLENQCMTLNRLTALAHLKNLTGNYGIRSPLINRLQLGKNVPERFKTHFVPLLGVGYQYIGPLIRDTINGVEGHSDYPFQAGDLGLFFAGAIIMDYLCESSLARNSLGQKGAFHETALEFLRSRDDSVQNSVFTAIVHTFGIGIPENEDADKMIMGKNGFGSPDSYLTMMGASYKNKAATTISGISCKAGT